MGKSQGQLRRTRKAAIDGFSTPPRTSVVRGCSTADNARLARNQNTARVVDRQIEDTNGTALKAPKVLTSRSHALRGNVLPDAPRRRTRPTFAHRADAERPIRHSHAERGNEHRAHESARAVVDLQIEDTNGTALKAPTVLTSRLPRSAWECSPRRSASSDRTDALLIGRTQSVQYGIPTRSVGTSIAANKMREQS